MARFADNQSDLFALPPAAAPPPEPKLDPVAELQAMLADLRPRTEMPWRTISRAMEYEYRVLWLEKEAGPDAAALSAAVKDEIERLLATTD